MWTKKPAPPCFLPLLSFIRLVKKDNLFLSTMISDYIHSSQTLGATFGEQHCHSDRIKRQICVKFDYCSCPIQFYCYLCNSQLSVLNTIYCQHYYASPTSGEAYRDRRLTTNFELWVEIFCVPTCFHVTIPKPCLSVCPSVRPSVRLSVCPSVRSPRKDIIIASSISVLH